MTAVAVEWQAVWERKGATVVDSYDLDTLIALDGFDGGAGAMTAEQFREVARLAAQLLDLGPGMRLLEVGCGAGALLHCLRETGAELRGVDYSPGLVEHARAAVPEAVIAVADAAELPFAADAIVCHSVFQYFVDLDYAARVLDGFRRAAPVALVLDVPDLARRDQAEAARAAQGSEPGTHLYYPRSFFGGGLVFDSEITGYGNAPYRFHALLRSRGSA
jgi:SAM-dependent methyltransferase